MKKKRRSRGRPSLPTSEQRHHRLTVGVTSEELRDVKSRARVERITPSEWLRRALLRTLGRRVEE